MSESRVARPPELDDSDQRVLLLVSGERDRELLADRLGERYHVTVGEPDAAWGDFDICLVDARTYRRVEADLAARKDRADAYLPVLLLVPDRAGTREAEWLAEELGGTVDDVLVVPSPKHELDARVEALLRARRQSRHLALYRRAMDEATVGIIITDPTRPDNPIVYANDWFCRLTGYDSGDVLGRNCRFLQGPETDDETVTDIRKAIEAEEPITAELLNYRADGESFWNLLTITPVRDEAGAVTHFLGFQRDVTDRVEATESLQEEREILKKVFDTSPAGIAVVDADGNFVRANATAEEELGLERSEITSRTISDPAWDIVDVDEEPIPPEDLPGAITLATGEPVTDYRMGITVDGERRWLSVDCAPLFDQAGSVEGAVVSIQDITDRLERERELERYETVVKTINDAAVIYDEDRCVSFCNRQFLDYVQRPRDEIIGRGLYDFENMFVDPESHAKYNETIEAILDGRREEASFDVTFDLPDRHIVTDLNFATVSGPDGPSGALVVGRDVTDRVERERELERYESIVETTSDLIFVVDLDGRFVTVNDAMVEASGYDRDELLGSHASKVADEETVDMVEGYIQELLEGDRAQASFEASMIFADGVRREFAASINVLRDEDAEFHGTVLSAHDITELRESKRRLSVLDRVLRHNLRNRMNVVLGYSQELAENADPEVADLGSAIEDSARNLLQLSESAREFESVVSGAAQETTTLDATDLVAAAVDDARDEHPAAEVSTDLPEAAPVRAHETFELALDELLENAIVHNDAETPAVDVSVAADDRVEIRIADDGPGLNDIDRRALDTGTESPLEHTQGLGLWLVRWAVSSVGGELDIADNDPRGTVLTLTLPRASD